MASNESIDSSRISMFNKFKEDALVVPILNQKYNLYIFCEENKKHPEPAREDINTSLVNITGDNCPTEQNESLVNLSNRVDFVSQHSSSLNHETLYPDLDLGLSQLFYNSTLQSRNLVLNHDNLHVGAAAAHASSQTSSLKIIDQSHLEDVDQNNNTISNSLHFQLSFNSSKIDVMATARVESSDDEEIILRPRNRPLIKIKYTKKAKKINHADSGHASDDSVIRTQPTQPRIRRKVRSNSYAPQQRIQKKYFYHYTNRSNLDSIKNDRLIRGSNGVYGYGVYGTSKPPQTKYLTLLKNNYLIIPNGQNNSDITIIQALLPFTECYLRISVDDLGPRLRIPDVLRPDVYMFPGDIDLNTYKFVAGIRKKYVSERAVVV